MFKISAVGSQVIKLAPVFLEGFEQIGPGVPKLLPGAVVHGATLKSDTGEDLFGKVIFLRG